MHDWAVLSYEIRRLVRTARSIVALSIKDSIAVGKIRFSIFIQNTKKKKDFSGILIFHTISKIPYFRIF